MILNGRTNGDFFGNFTHYNKNKGASTVDLAIVSCKSFESIKSFRIMPQLDLSGHCKIITQIDNTRPCFIESSNVEKTYNWLELPYKFKWDEEYTNKFKEILNSKQIENIISEAEQRMEAGLIESTGNKIQEIF